MKWFLQRLQVKDTDTIASATLLLALTVVAFVACCLFIPIFYYLGSTWALVFSATVTPFVGVSALVLRWTGSVKISGHYYVAVAWIYITGLVTLLGGADAPGPSAYYLLILATTFMIGGRAGILWTVIFILTVIVVELACTYWLSLPAIASGDITLLATITHVAMLGMICIFALKSSESKNVVVEELRAAYRQTKDMVKRLEEASERLVSSSEQLLGPGHNRRSGLVGKMMLTAELGRRAVEEAKHSVAGMVDQYRCITLDVQDLHRHSETIIDLVSTIDRISSRLDLMALNIGIEAAHGGQAARQFTIIAHDMRTLAERVFSETDGIKLSLQRVNAQVQKVLDSSAAGQGLTTESIERMNEMVSTFDSIYSLIEEAESQTGQITDDTIAQIDAVRRVVTATVIQR